jgi:predicted nucleotidyltransferase
MIPSEIAEYLHAVLNQATGVTEIWLIGSRANGTAAVRSDWDLLVFGGDEAHAHIKSAVGLHRDDVDLLVVDASGEFRKPWGDPKSGSLSSWEWKLVGPDSATYRGAKWIPDAGASDTQGGTLETPELVAQRIWCSDGIA